MKALNVLWSIVCFYTMIDVLLFQKFIKFKDRKIKKLFIANFLMIRIVFYIYIFKNEWWGNVMIHILGFYQEIIGLTPQGIYLLIFSYVIIFVMKPNWSQWNSTSKKFTVLIISEFFIINLLYLAMSHYFFSKGIWDVSQYTTYFIY